MERLEIYTDGASRGNPGHAGIGVVIFDGGGKVLEKFGEYIGRATNNIAEYKGLIAGLKRAKKYLPCSLSLYLDSELVVKQIKGEYRTKDEALKGYFEFARQLLSEFEKFQIKHIPRENNTTADKLANASIDEAVSRNKLDPVKQLTFNFQDNDL